MRDPRLGWFTGCVDFLNIQTSVNVLLHLRPLPPPEFSATAIRESKGALCSGEQTGPAALRGGSEDGGPRTQGQRGQEAGLGVHPRHGEAVETREITSFPWIKLEEGIRVTKARVCTQ